MRNTPKVSIYGMHTIIISLTNTVYGILTTKFIRGHQMSLEVKRRSILKCSPWDFIFGMHSHMISLTNISYDSLTSKVIRGHQRLLEVKRRSKLKISLREPIFDLKTDKRSTKITGVQKEVKIEKYTQGLHFGMHNYMISLTNIGNAILA